MLEETKEEEKGKENPFGTKRSYDEKRENMRTQKQRTRDSIFCFGGKVGNKRFSSSKTKMKRIKNLTMTILKS